MNLSTFQKHFGNAVSVDRNQRGTMVEVGGAVTEYLGTFQCQLTFEVDGKRLTTTGPCWVGPHDNVPPMLIGMPYFRQNNMHHHL